MQYDIDSLCYIHASIESYSESLSKFSKQKHHEIVYMCIIHAYSYTGNKQQNILYTILYIIHIIAMSIHREQTTECFALHIQLYIA